MAKSYNRIGSASEGRAHRIKLFEPAVLRVSGQEHRCHLLNVSRTGLSFHCDSAFDHDTSVVIVCNDHEMVARTRWSNRERHGASFVLPLADSTLAKLTAAR